MQPTNPHPHLLVTERHAWLFKRFFELYVLPHELVFLWAAQTVGDVKRGDALESQPLEQLRDDHPSNFVLRADDIESARLFAGSRSNPAGSLQLRVGSRDRKFNFGTSYDALVARGALPKTLGPRLTIDPELPTDKNFEYSGKTVLFYDVHHGNQLEFLDVDGRCYLWYPGNPGIVPGQWKAHGKSIAFRYGSNTFNPVTGVTGGGWETTPIDRWSSTIVDAQPGDICRLATGLPYVLFDHAGLKTVQDARRGKGKL
jgi:hypothetical protein